MADLMEERRREFMGAVRHSQGLRNTTRSCSRTRRLTRWGWCSGHMLHHRLTVDACRAGKHVLVEKADGHQPGAVR